MICNQALNYLYLDLENNMVFGAGQKRNKRKLVAPVSFEFNPILHF